MPQETWTINRVDGKQLCTERASSGAWEGEEVVVERGELQARTIWSASMKGQMQEAGAPQRRTGPHALAPPPPLLTDRRLALHNALPAR